MASSSSFPVVLACASSNLDHYFFSKQVQTFRQETPPGSKAFAAMKYIIPFLTQANELIDWLGHICKHHVYHPYQS